MWSFAQGRGIGSVGSNVMAIDFEHSDTDKINAKLAGCAECCPEPACLYAQITVETRDTEICKSGFPPYLKSEGRPLGFDLAGAAGTLIPVYKKATVGIDVAIVGSQAQTAKLYASGEVEETASRSYTAAMEVEISTEIIHQQARHEYLASNVPYGLCGDEAAVVAAAGPSGLAAVVGAYGTGFAVVDDYEGVILSWAENRPEYPVGTKFGYYVVEVDGAAVGGGSYIDELSVQIYLEEGDVSCHEFQVRHVVGANKLGQWSEPFLFHQGENDCCVVADGYECGGYVPGNRQTSNPTQAGISGSQTLDGVTTTAANIYCGELGSPGDAPLSNCLISGTSGISAVTVIGTASQDGTIEVWTTRRPTGALTNVEATGVTATGVTVVGGVITGGTITSGTLISADGTTGTLGGGSIVGTLTGGTITGGTMDGSGNLTGGTISGGSLSEGGSSATLDDDGADAGFSGWNVTSDAYSNTYTIKSGEGLAGVDGYVTLTDDINTGATLAAVLLTQLGTLVGGFSETYGWGLVINEPAWPVTPAAGAARVAAYWPKIGAYVSSSIWVRMREIRHQVTVPAEHVGTGYKTLWDWVFFPDAWVVWREAKIKWALAEYAWLNRPEVGDEDYPVIGDFSEEDDPSAALAAAIDALQKDPEVFPPAGWTLVGGEYEKGDESLTEQELRDRYRLYPDPGAAPSGPTVIDGGEWEWDSEQGPVDPEVVSPCDPTYAARLPDPEPVREDFPEGEEGTEDFDAAHEAWEEARDAAIERSTRTSPWFVFTPAELPASEGNFLIANVRHVCDVDNPNGVIENYDHDFPTSEVPDLDPTAGDPFEFAEWY